MIIKIKRSFTPLIVLIALMGLSAIRGSELDGSRGILGTFIEEEEGEHLFSPPKPKEEQDRETYQFSEPITGSQKKTKEAMNATFYNVGQGNGAYVVDKYTGNTLVVDCGSAALPLNYRGRPEGGKALASQFSKKLTDVYKHYFEEDTSQLGLVVSHPDEDHYGLIKHFIEKHIEKFGERKSFAYLGGPIAKYYKGKKGLRF